jgi:hypothetical protein
MFLEKYGAHAKITFNIQAFDLGADESIYYKAPERGKSWPC